MVFEGVYLQHWQYMIDMQENILENLEKGFISCTIFCDLSKAFESIDHDVLLWKLNMFLE